MRLIGIALLSFVLAGAALLLANGGAWERGIAHVSAGLFPAALEFDHQPLDVSPGSTDTVLRMVGADETVLLSGIPAWQRLTFLLPLDSRIRSGVLEIETTTQVLDGVEAVLRVSIRGTRRAEILLHPGQHRQGFRVDLTQDDLAGSSLVVSLSVQGRGRHVVCRADESREVVVEVEQATALHVDIGPEDLSIGDRVRANGNRAIVHWPEQLDPLDRRRALVVSALMARRGLDVAFAATNPAALQLDELETLMGLLPEQEPGAPGPEDVISLSQGANEGLRRFQRTTQWRYRHDPALGTGPGRLVLSLVTGPRFDDAPWVVDVTLNGRLIHAEPLAPSATSHRLELDLPQWPLAAAGELLITLTVQDDGTGECNERPERLAELHPDSALHSIGDAARSELAQLRDALAPSAGVMIAGDPGASGVDARAFSQLLAAVLPDSARPIRSEQVQGVPGVTLMLPGDSLPDADAGAGEDAVWVVFMDPDSRAIRATRPLDGQAPVAGPNLLLRIPVLSRMEGAR